MVGTTTDPALSTAAHAAVADLVAQRPGSNSQLSLRVRWLFSVADALAVAGYDTEATTAREAAIELVRDVVTTVGGGVL